MSLFSRPAIGKPLLDVKDLTIRFGQNEAVSDFTFHVDRGEILALVGESGCGKSTVALSLLNLLPRNDCTISGNIKFAGTEITSSPEHILTQIRGREVSMIFQDPMSSLNPVWSIGSQLIETIRKHERLSAKSARIRAIELLNIVRIPDPHLRIDDYPHQFSGGMRQRVMIAMAIACHPKLLIADEPTTALDVTIQAQILELIDQIRRELSMAVLLITHDLGIVADRADRVLVMYAGRKCEEAPANLLFQNPLHPYTQRLIAATPHFANGVHYTEGRLPEIPGSVASAASETGCRFAPRCELARAECRSAVPNPKSIDGSSHMLACPVNHPVYPVRARHAIAQR